MDNNKDESERCIVIALRLIAEGRKDKALKYLLKSEKLFPSDRAEELIEQLNCASNSSQTNSSSSHTSDKGKSCSSPSLKRRKTKVNDKGNDDCDQSAEYSHDQVEAVKSIKSSKDYYEILGVSKDATDSDLKKQYRKLALQFHPDKNKAPGASEAFKAIGNAVAVLSDPTKRKQYDTYGSEYLQRTPGNSEQNGHYDYSRGFEGDISAEEIFNMFFGGGFSGGYGGGGVGGNVYVRRGNQWQRYRQPTDTRQESGHSVMLQMMPLFVLVSLSLLSSFLVSDPPYSLTRTTKYYYEHKTRNLDIPYYVKENFLNEYKGKILRIESQVEEDYVSNIKSSCYRERNYKENMIFRAKTFRDVSLESKAKSLRTPSCDALNEIIKQY